MTIVLAGGTGFLGSALAGALTSRGDRITILSRGAGNNSSVPGTRQITWTPDGSVGAWARELEDADAIVNLAGAGIADRRWTAARKKLLRASRVLSTRSLVSAVARAAHKPRVFVQGSAVGFYGFAGNPAVDETSPPGDDYMARMTVDWEAEARPIEAMGVRLVIVRAGVVLARTEGVLQRLIPPFRFFVGGPIASGRQYMSWIHLDDWIAMMRWAIDDATVSGPVNASAPGGVTNEEFSRALGRAMHRPSWFRVPAFALRVIVGELADHALLVGQDVKPTRAQSLGFRFAHPEIGEAMRDVFRR